MRGHPCCKGGDLSLQPSCCVLMLPLFPTLLFPDRLSLTNSPPQRVSGQTGLQSRILSKHEQTPERRMGKGQSSTGLQLRPLRTHQIRGQSTQMTRRLCHRSSFICQSLWSLVEKCTSSLGRWPGCCPSSLRNPDRCAGQMC